MYWVSANLQVWHSRKYCGLSCYWNNREWLAVWMQSAAQLPGFWVYLWHLKVGKKSARKKCRKLERSKLVVRWKKRKLNETNSMHKPQSTRKQCTKKHLVKETVMPAVHISKSQLDSTAGIKALKPSRSVWWSTQTCLILSQVFSLWLKTRRLADKLSLDARGCHTSAF